MSTAREPAAGPAVGPKAPKPGEPQGCTNFKLRQLLRSVSRLYDAELAQAGLKTTQYSLLSHVQALGAIAPGLLAARMGMDASTLTRNLRPLTDQGLLATGPGHDARSRCITITDAGRERLAVAKTHWKTAQRRLNGLLGNADVVALHAMIDRVQERVNAAGAEPARDAAAATG